MTESSTAHCNLTKKNEFPIKWKRRFFSRQITKYSFELLQSCWQICKIKKILTALQVSFCFNLLLQTFRYMALFIWDWDCVMKKHCQIATSPLCNLIFNEIYFPFFRYGNFPLWCTNRPVYKSGLQLLCLATSI